MYKSLVRIEVGQVESRPGSQVQGFDGEQYRENGIVLDLKIFLLRSKEVLSHSNFFTDSVGKVTGKNNDTHVQNCCTWL